MVTKLYELSQELSWVASFKASNDDEDFDRLNHRYTVSFLLVCASIAGGAPFTFNRISCWVPAQFVDSYNKYTDHYCWIANTYYIPSNTSVPHSEYDRKHAEIAYYQWAPLIFLSFALFFYLPRMLWRSMNTRSGIDLQHLISKGKLEAIVESIELYCRPNVNDVHWCSQFCRTLFCTSNKRLGSYLRSIYIMTRFLYLINSFTQLILIHIVLGLPGWIYGVNIWYNVFIRNSVLTDSPYFPRVTLCDLRIREVGNLHRYTVQCVLPINMLNEKLFSIAWFWFAYVFISNIYSFVRILYETIASNSRICFIEKLYRIRVPRSSPTNTKLLKKFTREFLMQDGVLIIHLIYHNASAVLATRVVKSLFERYQSKGHKEISRIEYSDV